MTEHTHMFHPAKAQNGDPKPACPEPPRGAALQAEPRARGEQGNPKGSTPEICH